VNVAFVNYQDFKSNSAVHIARLADELTRLGDSCAVVVPRNPGTVDVLGEHRFQELDFRAASNGGLRFPNGEPPSLVHAWTPRERVRRLTEELAARYRCPYVVHLEDNEDVITAERLGITVSRLLSSNGDYDAAIGPTVSHPWRMRRFLAGAAGITVIVERLLELRPDGVPAEIVWPAYEPELFTPEPGDPELRRRLGLRDDDAVVVYAGNSHPSNAEAMRSLYLAVAAVNRAGRGLKLVRLGRDYVEFLSSETRHVQEHVVEVPFVPRAEVGRYLRLADVLVQPGRPNDFEEYRFPAKLTEFLATGRPVVLPATTLGRSLEDGEECILLRRGDALEIAEAIERVLGDAALSARLGAGARAFAERSFSWPRSARKLRRFYEQLLGAAPQPEAASPLLGLYSGRRLPRLSYATVRDYCDSADHLADLARASGDMKDVQRPWVLKAILGQVPVGTRLLEIGAGEPLVADLLSRLGYDVTVVDPYDGRDRGPANFDGLTAAFPRLRRAFRLRVLDLGARTPLGRHDRRGLGGSPDHARGNRLVDPRDRPRPARPRCGGAP
jgi:glycosyltransferase involved in cell wall biosynthesis